MSDPDTGQVDTSSLGKTSRPNPEIARATAQASARELKDTISSLQPESTFPVTNVFEILAIGAMVTVALAAYWKPESGNTILDEARQLCRTFELGSTDEAALEERFYRALQDGVVSPEEVREGVNIIIRILKSPVRQRQMMTKAIDEMLPPGSPGTLRKIEASEVDSLTGEAQRLHPLMRHFLMVREDFPSKSLEELISFLAEDHLEEAAVLAQNTGTVMSVLQLPEFNAFKTINAKARYMADAIAGAVFQLLPSYAHEVAEAGRRRLTKTNPGEKA